MYPEKPVPVRSIVPENAQNPLGCELWDQEEVDISPNAIMALSRLYDEMEKERNPREGVPVREAMSLDPNRSVLEQVREDRARRDKLLEEKHKIVDGKMRHFVDKQRSLSSSWALNYPRAMLDLAVVDRDVLEYIVTVLEEVKRRPLDNVVLMDLFMYLADGINERLNPSVLGDNFTGTPWDRVMANVSVLFIRFRDKNLRDSESAIPNS